MKGFKTLKIKNTKKKKKEHEGIQRRKDPETGERLGQAEEGRTFVNCQTGCGMRLSETLPPLFISFQNIPSTQSRLNLHTVRYPCLEQRWTSDVEAKSFYDTFGPSNQSLLFWSITLSFNSFIKTHMLMHTYMLIEMYSNPKYTCSPLCPPWPIWNDRVHHLSNDSFQDNNYKTLSGISKWFYILFKYLPFSNLTWNL